MFLAPPVERRKSTEPPLRLSLPDLVPSEKPQFTLSDDLSRRPLYQHLATSKPSSLEYRTSILHTVVSATHHCKLWLKRTTSMVGSVYMCSMERVEPFQPLALMKCKKRVSNGQSYIDFWVDCSDGSDRFPPLRKNATYIGSLVTSTFEDSFTLFKETRGNLKNLTEGKKDPDGFVREEVAAFLYKPNLVNGVTKNWQGVRVLLPGVDTATQSLVSYTPLSLKIREHLLSRWSHRREPVFAFSDLLSLESTSPFLTEDGAEMVLNRRRSNLECPAQLDVALGTIPVETVKVEPPVDKSVRPKKGKGKGRTTPKPIVIEDTEKPAVFHVERLDKETVAVSFTYPLTAYAAFALAMSLLDGKAADDFVIGSKISREEPGNQPNPFAVLGVDFDLQAPLVTGKMVDELLKSTLQ